MIRPPPRPTLFPNTPLFRLGGDFPGGGAAHRACSHASPEAGCVSHAPSLNVMPCLPARGPIPPMSEQTDKYGPIGFCEWAATHTDQLAINVVAALRPMADQIKKHPIATLIPRHGDRKSVV